MNSAADGEHSASALATGVVLGGQYELKEQVSEGPYAVVWSGSMVSDGSRVAIKVARNDLGARMLQSEVRIAGDLINDTGVVPILDHGAGNPFFVVMPWIQNGSFRQTIDSLAGRDSRARAARRLIQVVLTVADVHDHEVIHGDLKPENVLLDSRGEPMLTDFGLAQQYQEIRREHSLQQSLSSVDGVAGGTLAYLPPEAVKGAEPSKQGDVYALGVMFHEILIGGRPGKATGPQDLRAHLPEAAVEVFVRSLAFNPEDRYPDARAFLLDLLKVRGAVTSTGPGRWLRLLARSVLRLFAAFFVLLRYLSVAMLISVYSSSALFVVGTLIFGSAPSGEKAALIFGFGTFSLMILMLHGAVRWEGPESSSEAATRKNRVG